MVNTMQYNSFLKEYDNAIIGGAAQAEAAKAEAAMAEAEVDKEKETASWEEILKVKEEQRERRGLRNNKKSKKRSRKDEYNWWAERMARHDMYMQLFLAGRGVYYSPHFTGLGNFPGSYSRMMNLKSLVSIQAESIAQQKLHLKASEGEGAKESSLFNPESVTAVKRLR